MYLISKGCKKNQRYCCNWLYGNLSSQPDVKSGSMKCTTLSPVAVIALFHGCDTVETQKHKTPPLPVKGESPLPLIQESSYRNLPSNTHLDCRRTKTAVASIDWQPIESVLGQAQRILDTEYVAVFGVRDSSGNFYSYHLQELAFSPETVEQAGGKVRPYIYEFLAESGQGLLTTRIAIAYIPDTDLAEQSITYWLLPNTVKERETESPAKRAKAGVGVVATEQTCYYSMYVLQEVIIFVIEYCESDDVVVAPSGGGGDDDDSRNDDPAPWNWPQPRPPDSGGGRDGRNTNCNPPYRCGDEDEPICDLPHQVLRPAGCEEPEDCAGVVGGTAYTDTCGHCVGGTTGKISCCASQEKVIERLIEDEGGYSNHRHDAGGKTKYGIIKRTWDAHAQSVLGIDPRTFPVENITEAQATKIYKQVYWGWSKAEDISRMDGDLATVYFNFFANTPEGAVRAMQRALNSAGHSVSVDGGMGPQTLDAIENAIQGGKLGHLHNEFKVKMQDHYNERIELKPKNLTFSNGWTNRINRFSDKSAAQTRNVHCKN